MPLYRRYADTAGFPEVRPLLRRLGIRIENDELQLLSSAELAHIRDDIVDGRDFL